MQISKIERQKKNPQRYSIFIEENYAFGIDEQVLLSFAIRKGMTLTEKLIEEILKAEFQQSIYIKALNYLSYGLRSEKEVYEYLRKLPLLQAEELDVQKLFKVKPARKRKARKGENTKLSESTTDPQKDLNEASQTNDTDKQTSSTPFRLKPTIAFEEEKQQHKKGSEAEEIIQRVRKISVKNISDFDEETQTRVPRKMPNTSSTASTSAEVNFDKENFINSIIEAAIVKLKDQNLINDKLYGEAYLRTQANLNRKGPSKIGYELKRKGLDSFLIEDILMQYDPNQMHENMQEVAEKFLRTKKLPAKMMRMKLQQHFIQKGYPQEAFNDFFENFQVKVAEEEESDLLDNEAAKSLRKRRRKLEGYSLKQKVFQDLMVKGYEYSLIQHWLDDHAEEFEEEN